MSDLRDRLPRVFAVLVGIGGTIALIVAFAILG